MDTASQGKIAVGEGVGGALGGDLGEKIFVICVVDQQIVTQIGSCRGGGQTVHFIVGVLGTGGFRISRRFHPFQQVGVGIVAVGGYLAQSVRGGFQTVAIVCVVGCAGDFRFAVDNICAGGAAGGLAGSQPKCHLGSGNVTAGGDRGHIGELDIGSRPIAVFLADVEPVQGVSLHTGVFHHIVINDILGSRACGDLRINGDWVNPAFIGQPSLVRGHGDGVGIPGGGGHCHGDILGQLPGAVIHIGRGHGEHNFLVPVEEQNLPVFLQLRRQILHLNGDHIGRNILLAVKDDIFLRAGWLPTALPNYSVLPGDYFKVTAILRPVENSIPA